MSDPSHGSARFAYDHAGRRIERTLNGVTTRYLYHGPQAVAELQGNAVGALYHTGLAIDEVLARYAGGGDKVFLSDALGSIIAESDVSGGVVTRRNYSPYGEGSFVGMGSDNPLGYTSREDDGTGLYYYRARYYDPQLKRFVSADPIGLEGGINVYGYVGGNPAQFVDPSGYDSLVADNGTLTHYSDDNSILGRYTYTSGRNGITDPSIPWQGPIPPGKYYLNPRDIDHAGWLRRIKWSFDGDWGSYRVHLLPDEKTQTFNRDGFFMHGGLFDGSAGCIDVGSDESKVFPVLMKHDGIIEVIVK